MKKIGIVGGVAWPSTVEYYAGIYRRGAQLQPPVAPEMSIESLDHNRAVSYLGVEGDEESWRKFDEYHRTALQRLKASGADFAVIASNAPHHRFESIIRGVGIPVISIFEEAAKESARRGATQILILGTALTMSSRVCREVFAKHGVEAAGPEDEIARSLTIELIADLQSGNPEGAAERLGRIAISSFEPRFTGRPAVCLACTELPLAFPQLNTAPAFVVGDILYINSVATHVQAAFEFAVEG